MKPNRLELSYQTPTQPRGGRPLHEQKYNTGHGIQAILDEVCTEIRRQPCQPQVQQKPLLHLLLEGPLGRQRGIPGLGLTELWGRLKKRGYVRRPESLFRVVRKLGLAPQPQAGPAYKPKPYEQISYPGQRIQADVKVVPRRCITDPGLRLFQYSAIDEFTRLRFLAAYPE